MKRSYTLAGWALLAAAFLAVHPATGAEGWLTDFEQARAQAQEKNRPILVNFSGSDWCGWCIRLDNEVLDKAEFKAYAQDSLVLFLADFPRRTKLPETVERQNRTLLERYGVQGFPTVLLLNAKGEVLARTGYRPGGAEAYIEHIKTIVAGAKAEPPARTPAPYEYDAENDRYWHPGHSHWHRGRPPTER